MRRGEAVLCWRVTIDEALADLALHMDEAIELQPDLWFLAYRRSARGRHSGVASHMGDGLGEISPERIAELVIPDLSAEAVILLHDSSRYTHRPDSRATVEALPLISAAAADRGLPFLTLAEAVDGR